MRLVVRCHGWSIGFSHDAAWEEDVPRAVGPTAVATRLATAVAVTTPVSSSTNDRAKPCGLDQEDVRPAKARVVEHWSRLA